MIGLNNSGSSDFLSLESPPNLTCLAQAHRPGKGYRATEAEIRELHRAMDRHDGLFTSPRERAWWQIIERKAIGSTSVISSRLVEISSYSLVGGSDDDPFEHRQISLARERLGTSGSRPNGCRSVTSPHRSS
jgi:hypothetical protein